MQQDAAQENPKKLFVGNLSFNTTRETVESIFSEYGTLTDVALIIDRMSGRSKGIAFVTFETQEQAQAAIEALNGFEVDGRELIVNVARPRVQRDDQGGGGYNNRRSSGGGNDRRGGGNNRGGFGGSRPSRF